MSYDEPTFRQGQGLRHMSDPSLEPLRRWLPALTHWTRLRLCPSDFLVVVPEQLHQQVREAFAFLEQPDAPRAALPLTMLRNSLVNWIARVPGGTGPDAASSLPPDQRGETNRPPLEAAMGKQALDRYERALRKLDDREREAIIGRLEMAGSYQTLATSRGLSAVAARLAVLHAIIHLAVLMNDDEA